MPSLYPDVVCPSCGKPHNFSEHTDVPRPIESRFCFTCPVTGEVTSFRSHTTPLPVILCPAGTVPALWFRE
jgi:hypothetical protein